MISRQAQVIIWTVILLMGDPVGDRPLTNLLRVHRIAPNSG